MNESVSNPFSMKLSFSMLCKHEGETGLKKFLYSEHCYAHLLQTTSWGPGLPLAIGSIAIISFLIEIAYFSLFLCNLLSAKKWKVIWLICGLIATHSHPISFKYYGGVWLYKNPQKWLITPYCKYFICIYQSFVALLWEHLS